MAAWRRKAFDLFPELHRNLNERRYSIYLLYFDLLPLVRDAHDSADEETLRRSYSFAEWCFDQRDKNLWNAVAVAFYEHLFDSRRHWSEVIPRLSERVITECGPLWELRLSASELAMLREAIARYRRPRDTGHFNHRAP